MKSHELARQLLAMPNGEVLLQQDGSEICRGVGDPLTHKKLHGKQVVVLSPYGEKGHLDIIDHGEEASDEVVYIRDVAFA